MRKDGRELNQLRPVKITRGFTSAAPASALVEMGNNKILCTASLDFKVPNFLANSGKGWITAEYGMLPGSTSQRRGREGRIGKVDGRSQEIQRLIGRAMRSITDLELLNEKTIWLDCDVLQADGGTRTASITGAYVVLQDMMKYLLHDKLVVKNPIKSYLAAVSVGKVKGQMLLDLNYEEDFRAEVDLNVVMTESGKLVEIQGTAEGAPFTEQEFTSLLGLAKKGIADLIKIQKTSLKT